MSQAVEMVELVARRLGELKNSLAFVGGAVTGLLITDPAAPKPRPTDDVDAIVQVATRAKYYDFSARLRKLGFVEDTSQGAPTCRWLVQGIKVDVMPTSEELLGYSNRWYSEALQNAVEREISHGTLVRVVTAPYFVATKLEAYRGRGNADFASSHDVEDIIAVVDGRPELIDECAASAQGLREYIADQFGTLLGTAGFPEAVAGHLPGDNTSQDRVPIVLDRLRALARLGSAI